MRVIATLTTTPHRQDKQLKRTIKALQACDLIDEIWLQLPQKFRRNPGLPYNSVEPVGKLKIFRVDDVGPATKLVGAAHNPDLRDDDVLIVTDDDVVIDRAAVKRLIDACVRDSNYVHSQMGGVLNPDGTYSEGIIQSGDGVGTIVDYFVASTGVAVRGCHLRGSGPDLSEYMERCFRAFPVSILSDDLVLANWFVSRGVETVALDLHSTKKGKDSSIIGVEFTEDDEHSLNRGASGDADPNVAPNRRYGEVRRHFKDNGLWFGEV